MKMKPHFIRRYVAAIVTLCVIAFALFVYRAYRSDLALAFQRTASGTVVQTACGPIEYAEIGKGAPVLAVHGAGGGYDQGLDFGIGLAARGFRVIAMSRFGYLRTPLPQDASSAAQADAHACLLDALHIPKAAIIGASAGAPSAWQFALRHPDRCDALILLVPAMYVPRGDAPSLKTPAYTELLFATALRWDFAFWMGPKIARGAFIRGILATPPNVVQAASSEERARIDAIIDHILPVSTRRLGLLNDAQIASTLTPGRLDDIKTPTLAISVADDLYGTYDAARYSASQIPNARFVGYEQGGHVWVGHHGELNDEIAGFLHQSVLTK